MSAMQKSCNGLGSKAMTREHVIARNDNSTIWFAIIVFYEIVKLFASERLEGLREL